MTDKEELREKILELKNCTGPYDSPHRCSALHCDHCGLCDISEDLLHLIDEQTRAEIADRNLHELCWEEDRPLGTSCDRKKDHKGVHSWDEAI